MIDRNNLLPIVNAIHIVFPSSYLLLNYSSMIIVHTIQLV